MLMLNSLGTRTVTNKWDTYTSRLHPIPPSGLLSNHLSDMQPLVGRAVRSCRSQSTARQSSRVARPIADRYDSFIFDCDGVLWKGNELIEGADATIRALQAMQKNVFFMTNNSLKTRKDCILKFKQFGIDIEDDQMLCSAFAAAKHLSSRGFPNSNKKVYVIGEQSIVDELSLMGIDTVGGPSFAGRHCPVDRHMHVDIDPDVAAVVVGCDRAISYYKLLYGQLCLHHIPNCLFIATNTDMVKHLSPTQEHAGAGAMVAALAACTNKTPIVTGKPNPYMADYLVDRYKLDRRRLCMVGDRLDTDIQFGISAGVDTCLTLSGCTSRGQVEHPQCTVQPDYVVDSIASLL